MARVVLTFMTFLILVCGVDELRGNFFFHPETISHDELMKQVEDQSVEMFWQFDGDALFHFIRKRNEIYLEIFYDKPPRYRFGYIEHTFDADGEEKKKYSLFSYERTQGNPVWQQPRKPEKAVGPNTPSYLVDERRQYEQATPHLIDAEALATLITEHNVLFYTGAGISIAAGIPSMAQLERLIGLKKGITGIFFLKQVMDDPEEFNEKIGHFYNACFYGHPSKAHEALKQLAFFKNTKIVTENIDLLHEYTGIVPYRVKAEQLRKEVGSDQLRAIDYVICVGLSYDDKGFLGWYKRHNPNGRIIAIDLAQPSYLGDDDFLIQVDLQQLLPALAEKIICSRSSGG